MVAMSTSRLRRGSGAGAGRTRRLTREAVVQAAVRLARREGIDALSMRRVADEVGTAPMSLYRHVADRQALLLAMLDDVVSSLELPAAHADPASELSAVLGAIHRVLRREPWVTHLVVVEGMASPAIMPAVERIFAALACAGVPDSDLPAAYSLLWHYVEGEAMAAHHDRPDTFARRMFAQAVHDDPVAYPVIRRASSVQVAVASSRDYFDANLQRLLRGVLPSPPTSLP